MQFFTDNESSFAKQIVKVSGYGAGLCTISVCATAFVSLGTIRNLATGHGVYVSLGPFKYLYIYKSALIGGGYTLTVTLCIGLFIYLIICIAAELLVIWLVRRQVSKKSRADA
jgi:hypothetical protein